MYGTIVNAFIAALRNFPDAKKYNLNVIQVNDRRGTAIINTALPCCTISLADAAGTTTFISGGIYEHLKLLVQVIIDFINHSASPDGGIATQYQNLPYQIRRYLENEINNPQSIFFKPLRHEHGFSAIYESMKTYMSVAHEKRGGKEVLVYSLTWNINAIDPESIPTNTVTLETIDTITLENITPPTLPGEIKINN